MIMKKLVPPWAPPGWHEQNQKLVVVAAAAAGAAAAVGHPVEQAAAGSRRALRDAAEDADQRVLGPAPRLLVGLGGVPDLLAHRGVGVLVPARVVAAEDPLVLAVRGPVVELSEPDQRERARVPLQLQDLQDAVPQVRHRVVLV